MDDSESLGLFDVVSKALDGVGEISEVVDGSRYEIGEVKADAEGVIGRGLYGLERIQRGRAAVRRLRDPNRAEKPNAIEVGLETWNFLFGDGDGE